MKSDAKLERLLDAVRRVEPEPIAPEVAAAMVDAALDDAAPNDAAEGEAYRLPERRRALPAIAFAAAAALALAASVAWPRHESDSTTSRLTLPSGDEIVAAAGARFEVELASEASRRIRMDEGAMLFDVAPLGDTESFEVGTPGVVVRVRGTVFSVQASDDSTVVRVYEGEVEVEHDGTSRMLRRDEVWASSTRMQSADPELERIGQEAAQRRDTVHEVAAVAAPVTSAMSPEVALPTTAPEPVTAVEPPVLPQDVLPQDGETAERLARPERERMAREVDFEGAMRLLASGDYADALTAARAALARGPNGAWRLLEADALRGLHRLREAAVSYDLAAVSLDGSQRQQAGFKGAQLRFQQLDDARGALAALDMSEAWHEGSPLEERALGLRIRALHRIGRDEEARAQALRYLGEFPNAALADWMRRLVESPEAVDP